VLKVVAGVLSIVAIASLAMPVLADDDFPIVGTYTENQPCKGDASDANASRVKISPRDIDSVFGLCTIVNRTRDGNTFAVHVECKGPGGSQMLGDINFTLRADKTIDFSDQDKTYKAVLYKCPD
jgi:hypothetical protein